ncbi:MAG: hypothetical protein AB7E36_04635 [Salinivirgaceae bacterium]
MPEIFSFIKDPFVSMLEASVQLIPGIEKSTLLYFDVKTHSIRCKNLHHTQHPQVNEFVIVDDLLSQKLRKKKFQFQWMRSDQLPFEIVEKQQKQLNIFDETANVVLALAFQNEHDSQSDLLFLYLNRNLSSFGLSNSSNTLTTSEKNIIGTLAYNSFKLQLKKNQSDKTTLLYVNRQIKNLQQQNEQLQSEINQLKRGAHQNMVNLCHSHLQQLSSKYQINFSLDKSALRKLEHFSGSLEQLKSTLSQAAHLALNMQYGTEQTNIILKAWDIQFDSLTTVTESPIEPGIQERYQKTYLLLEKLEHAARRVLNNQDRLTSENVGSACPTPISAPAISDALKNHHKKAIILLNQFPDRWPTLRNEFRPVRNLLSNKQAI